MSGTVTAVLPWGRLGAGTTGGVVCGVVSPAPKRIWLFGQSRGQLRQALRVITSSSSAPGGRYGGSKSSQPQHPNQLNPKQVGWHLGTVEQGVARLNDFALGDIDQLAAHEVQESAWNVGGALRKHVGRQGCPVKGKEMKSSAERLSYHDAVELG